MGVFSNRECIGPRQSEISQLQIILIINQQVMRLLVSMQDSIFVAVYQTIHHLLHIAFH